MTHYQLIAITLGMILLGGTILGSTPFAFADHDDDGKEKLKAKLKDLLEKIKAKIEAKKDDDKCPDKKKYNGICDNKKPEVDITFPQKRDQVQSPVTITGTASDVGSGLKEVLVRIDFGQYVSATINNGDWELTTALGDGRHLLFAKAIDKVDNSKRDFTIFTVFS